MQKTFYEDGLKFECQQCSACCGITPGFVYLSKRDFEVLCKKTNMNAIDFVNKYCRWAGYYEGKEVLALKEKNKHYCIFWEKGCSIYEARPIQCSTWPFWTWIVENKENWEECAKDCKGMNFGKTWSKKEIEENSKKYSENIPLEKSEFEKEYLQAF